LQVLAFASGLRHPVDDKWSCAYEIYGGRAQLSWVPGRVECGILLVLPASLIAVPAAVVPITGRSGLPPG
jgi:hypothetical protein